MVSAVRLSWPGSKGEPGIQAKRYFICFDRVYGPVSKALSGGSLVAPPAALTISYIRFSEAMSCGSNVAM